MCTLRTLRRTLGGLNNAELRLLVRTVTDRELDWEDEVHLPAILEILWCNWLTPYISAVNRLELATAFRKDFSGFAEIIGSQPDSKTLHTLTTVLADNRYVSCYGNHKFYDLVEGTWIDELPCQAVTHVVCDVTALWSRFVACARSQNAQPVTTN